MERKIKDRQVACSVLKPEWIHQGKKNRLSYLLNHPVFVKKKKNQIQSRQHLAYIKTNEIKKVKE